MTGNSAPAGSGSPARHGTPAGPGAPGPDAGEGTYALLTDGSTVQIRAARAQDAAAVEQMHTAMSPENIYLRFFSLSMASAEREARRICRAPGQDHVALLAWLGDRLVGVASYEPTGKPRKSRSPSLMTCTGEASQR